MCVQTFLSPSSDETTSCQGIQILPCIVLDNEVFNRNRNSKDHLNLYEQFLIAAVCQRRATGSASEGHYKTGPSHNSNYLFTIFGLFLPPVFNEVEARDSPEFFYILEN